MFNYIRIKDKYIHIIRQEYINNIYNISLNLLNIIKNYYKYY